MIEEIKKIIDTHEYVIDHWLINRIDNEFKKGSYSSRENCNALALEITLKEAGILKTLDKVEGESYQWRHDWAYDENHLIDLKCRPVWSNNYSVSVNKESVKLGQVTHIVGFKQNIVLNDYVPHVGKTLKFTCEGIIPVEDVEKYGRDQGGWYLLDKKYLHLPQTVV